MSNKRGSLNLSINAIVVLILAITMLGLGLGFMRNTFGGVTSQFEDVTDQMKKEMIDRLAEGAKKAALNVYELDMKQSEERKIYLAIKDELASSSTQQQYNIGQTVQNIDGGTCPTLNTMTSITLSAGEAKVIPIRITTDSSHSGTCYYDITVTPQGSSIAYASEDLYVTIK